MERSYQVIYDARWSHFFVYLLFCVFYVYRLIEAWHEKDGVLMSLSIVIIAAAAFECIRVVVFLNRTPRKLVLDKDRLQLGATSFNPEQIQKIMLTHYFREPAIGILPVNRRMVPHRYVFRFLEQGSLYADELVAWAKEQRVDVVYKNFFRWY